MFPGDSARRKKYIIDLEPVGRRVEVEGGTNLLEAAQKAGVDLVASCGGIGICGTCRVRIAAGKVTPVTLTEEEALDAAQRAAGFRLACQTEPLSDVRIDIPPDSLTAAQQMQVEG
ncbi:MAG: 2Fe-2S iron-sulfur cluster binding domain-containing protein, partial [Anaerolineaceae bacterium]|nr:2Fe-2S iron-sulfur cluster binding domain-containing protein [Anaerolineaceae bacterium]